MAHLQLSCTVPATRSSELDRLCTIAGFYRYAVEEDLLDHSPAAHVRRPRLDYESHAAGLDRNELTAAISPSRKECRVGDRRDWGSMKGESLPTSRYGRMQRYSAQRLGRHTWAADLGTRPGLSLGLIHPRPRPFTGGQPDRVRAVRGRR